LSLEKRFPKYKDINVHSNVMMGCRKQFSKQNHGTIRVIALLSKTVYMVLKKYYRYYRVESIFGLYLGYNRKGV